MLALLDYRLKPAVRERIRLTLSIGDLVKSLLARLKAGAGYSGAGWESFADMILGLRFAWLSDRLRRDDRETVDLEAVFIDLLLENREALLEAWA